MTLTNAAHIDLHSKVMDHDKVYNVGEAAEFLGLTKWAIRKRILRGTLLAIRIGNGYYVHRSTLLHHARTEIRKSNGIRNNKNK